MFKKGLVLGSLVALLMATVSFGGWELNLNYPYGPCFSVFFINEQIGFCSGRKGAIFRTDNEGSSWQEVLESSDSRHISAIYFPNPKDGWVVGSINDNSGNGQGVVYFTQDSGETWTLQDTFPLAEGFSDVEFIDSIYGWIVGSSRRGYSDSAVIYHTIDGGKNWIRQDAGFEGRMGNVSTIDQDSIWAIGSICSKEQHRQGILLYTTNGGNFWSIEAQKPCTLYTDIQFLNSQIGFMCGYYNNYPDTPAVIQDIVWKTINGGQSWDIVFQGPIKPNAYHSFYTLDFIDPQVGWVGGDTIIHTTNGGNSWMHQSIEDSIEYLSIFSISALSRTDAWATQASIIMDQDWHILHYTGTGVEEITPVQKQMLEVYPNPFQGQIKVVLSGFSLETIKDISIYNIAGIKIRGFSPRQYVVWKDNTPAGIYFVKVRTERESFIKKMIKLR